MAVTYSQTGIVVKTQERQSAWGPGDAIGNPDPDPIFFGPVWNDSTEFGKIVGGPTTLSYPNPKYIVYKACKLIPFANCGSQPAKNLTKRISTETGAEAEFATAGRVGLELDYAFDAGSVGAELNYSVGADIPKRGEIEIGKAFSLNTTSDFVSGSLDSQSPTAEASIDVVADISLELSTRGCLVGKCDADNLEIVDLKGFRKELISVDPVEINYLDGFLPDGIELTTPLLKTGVSLEADLVTKKLEINAGKNNNVQSGSVVDSLEPDSGVNVELANLTIQAPLLELNGVKADGEDGISVDGTAEFISLNADIDGLLTYVNALPPTGLRADFGKYISGSLDLLDVEVGPTVGVFQSFDLTQSLMVDLVFDQAVDIGGNLVTAWNGLWDELPELSIFGRTVATPTFYVDAELKSTTGLDFGFDLTADILKGNISVGSGKVTAFSGDFGPLQELGFDDPVSLARVALFDDSFKLGGLNQFEGQAFILAAATTAVPVPAGMLLLLTSFGMILSVKRRTA